MLKPNRDFLPQDGQYHALMVYKKSECICDVTDYFCKTFLDGRRDRTVDQMVQAARSGKQNIVEGTAASVTSKETEIKLLNVAKASHQELLEDYKDYLAHHNLTLWSPGHRNYDYTRRRCREHNNREYYNRILPNCTDEMICNIAITLICQVDLMLRNLIEYHKQAFLEQGGIREEMTRGRLAYRDQHPGQRPVATATMLSRREQELSIREQEVTRREQDLARREQELTARENELARLLRLASQLPEGYGL
jgi:four helix bundle suffix protein